MNSLLARLLVLALFYTLSSVQAGCSSAPILAKDIEVKVSREAPSSECQTVGVVQGQTMTSQGDQAEALADLKKEAALRGANFVQIEQFSGYGGAVNGTAYFCP